MSSLSTNLLALIYAAFIVLEYWMNRPARPSNFGLKNAAINVSLGTLSGLADLFVIGFYLVFYQKMEAFSLFHLDYSWKYWLLLFLGHDFLYFTMHVCEHKIRLFWAVHFTHHSSREMNLTVAIRSSIFQPFYRYAFYLPLIFVGFHGVDIFLIWLVANTWGQLRAYRKHRQTRFFGNVFGHARRPSRSPQLAGGAFGQKFWYRFERLG